MRSILLAPLALLALPALGDEPEVRLPLADYQALLRAPGSLPCSFSGASLTADRPPAPATALTITVKLRCPAASAEVPVLPALPGGLPPDSAKLGADEVGLRAIAGWWTVSAPAGTSQLTVELRALADLAGDGGALTLPLPPAPGTTLRVPLPPGSRSPAALPSADSVWDGTTLQATAAAAGYALVTWQRPASAPPTLSRAEYEGALVGDAVRWTARFGAESTGAADLALLPSTVALLGVTVDGRETPLSTLDGRHAARLPSAGAHTVIVRFEVPVIRGDGPPRVELSPPPAPVSQFTLQLDGDKEVTATPAATVERIVARGVTRASAFVPATEVVVIGWSEAVPEPQAEELRAHAELVHTAWADESVLSMQTAVALEVTRGATHRFELDVPAELEINGVSGDGVADWRLDRARGKAGVLTVFFDRDVTGTARVVVTTERPLAADPVRLPLLAARGVSRSRAMVALLASRDLTLAPVEETGLVRVGENQLPPEVREGTDRTIAHTWKVGEDPALTVRAEKPPRVAGRYSAVVDTLVSLGDVSLNGMSTVEIEVKSGGLDQLRIALPAGVQLGGLTAPSMREHKLSDDGRTVTVDFTQELTGRFRVELRYELLTGELQGQLAVPTPRIPDAEVEQGRIAVEATAAVEVRAGDVVGLSTLDLAELPRSVLLQTSRPILLAYKYVQVTPSPSLSVVVTRHAEVDVMAAAVEDAWYQTVATRDGLMVTAARFVVQNRREQFLRIRLPRGAEVWRASVDGEDSKPALAEDGALLLKILNVDRPFPVELVVAVPSGTLGALGRLTLAMPEPAPVVTRTRWDIALPPELSWGEPDSELLRVVGDPERGGPIDRVNGLALPPTVRWVRFQAMFANRGGDAPTAAFTYTSPGAGAALRWLHVLAALALLPAALWIPGRRRLAAAAGLGFVAAVIPWMFDLTWTPAVIALLIGALGAGIGSMLGQRLPGRAA